MTHSIHYVHRSSIGENLGKDFDEHAKRLGRLFGQGTDSHEIANHALDIEKRAVKQKLQQQADEQESKRWLSIPFVLHESLVA